MMSLDCPLVIRHKKGEYIWTKIGGDFVVLELYDVFILMFLFRSCQSALKSIQKVFEIGSKGACMNLHKATYNMNKTDL